MPKALSFSLLLVGIVLLVMAAFAADSFSSGVSSAVQGTPDNRTIVLLISGLLSLGIGGFGLLRSSRS